MPGRELKIWLAALIVGAIFIGLAEVYPVGADVSNISPTGASFNSGNTQTVFLSGQDDSGMLQIAVTGAVTPKLKLAACSGGLNNSITVAACTAAESGDGTSNILINTAPLDSDNIPQSLTVTLSLSATCTSTQTVAVVAFDGSQTNNTPVQQSFTCTPVSTPGSTCTIATCFVIAASASPNIVPCGGGSSTITAQGMTSTGDPVPNLGFAFSTTNGYLAQSSKTTATLTLAPGQTSATVTATTIDERQGSAVSGTVQIIQACNGFASVVVTAQPNVIPCGGQSVITATARDVNGHTVTGVGFHLTVDSGGILAPPPNDATGEGNTAVLTILPGQTSATVKVSVGTTVGDVAGQVTVQQFCSPETNAPGKVTLQPSSTSVSCGSSLFIGATVKDSKGSIAADGTSVEFIASTGGFGPPQAPSTTGAATTPPSPDVTATTISGALHVVYNAPAGFSGDVTITAGAGASFAPLTLHVTCGSVAGATGATGARITAPNTGEGGTPRISPPNTGSGGLLGSE